MARRIILTDDGKQWALTFEGQVPPIEVLHVMSKTVASMVQQLRGLVVEEKMHKAVESTLKGEPDATAKRANE